MHVRSMRNQDFLGETAKVLILKDFTVWASTALLHVCCLDDWIEKNQKDNLHTKNETS